MLLTTFVFQSKMHLLLDLEHPLLDLEYNFLNAKHYLLNAEHPNFDLSPQPRASNIKRTCVSKNV